MADKTLSSLTAATPATGGLIYGTQSGADRKFTLSAAGAAVAEATTAADQRTALDCPGLAAANIFTVSGEASVPAVSLTGSVFAGGTATTTKPHFLIEPTGTTSTNWSTGGTMLGLNAASGFAGYLLNLQQNGADILKIGTDGRLDWGYIGSFGRQPILYVKGQYANVEWTQWGDGGIFTASPLLVDSYLSVETPGNSALRMTISWDGTNTTFSSTKGQFAFGAAAQGVTDTDGFFCLRSCAGTPTGTPASIPTGAMPVVYDSTNNKIMVYNGGWKATAALT